MSDRPGLVLDCVSMVSVCGSGSVPPVYLVCQIVTGLPSSTLAARSSPGRSPGSPRPPSNRRDPASIGMAVHVDFRGTGPRAAAASLGQCYEPNISGDHRPERNGLSRAGVGEPTRGGWRAPGHPVRTGLDAVLTDSAVVDAVLTAQVAEPGHQVSPMHVDGQGVRQRAGTGVVCHIVVVLPSNTLAAA